MRKMTVSYLAAGVCALALIAAFAVLGHGHYAELLLGAQGVVHAGVFTFRKAGAVMAVDTTTTEQMAFLPAATGSLRLIEASASGTGTATAANEFQIAPGTWVTGTQGALTSIAAFAVNPLGTTASTFTSGTTFATSLPTVNAQAGIGFGVNSNGGTYRWLAKTNFELYASGATSGYQSLNWKCIATGASGNVVMHAIVEQIA